MPIRRTPRWWLLLPITLHLCTGIKIGHADETFWSPPKFQCILESETQVSGNAPTIERWRVFYDHGKFRIEELTAPTKMVWIYDGNPEWIVWQCHPIFKLVEAVWEARVKHPMKPRAMPYARRFPPTGVQWGWDLPPCIKYKNLKYPPGELVGEKQLGEYRCKVFLTRSIRERPIEIGYAPFIRWIPTMEETRSYDYVWNYHGKPILIATEWSCRIIWSGQRTTEQWRNKFFMYDIQINPSFATDVFRPPAGFTVHVPFGVQVHLPNDVKVIRYKATLPPLIEVRTHAPSER